jgi:hypothetical protein
MSAGKGDKWRQTDYKKYYNAPFWEKREKKLGNEQRDAKIISDASNDKLEKQRPNSGR